MGLITHKPRSEHSNTCVRTHSYSALHVAGTLNVFRFVITTLSVFSVAHPHRCVHPTHHESGGLSLEVRKHLQNDRAGFKSPMIMELPLHI